jgi:pimeloyl-ACP methyl ester carboxylesterase
MRYAVTGRGTVRSEIVTIWLNASFEMRFRLIGGLTVRFAASQGHADQALLLSPWPESLLAFEPMWWRLAERTHLVAVDLPGFGHSQRSDALLSPQAMGEFIIAVADAFGLEHPHVVAPSIGTPAALFAAARHPGRLRSLVVGSGAAAVPLQLGGMVRDIIEAPDLDGLRSTDPRQLVNAALSGIRRYSLPESVRDDYLASYQGDRFAQSVRYLRSYPASPSSIGASS